MSDPKRFHGVIWIATNLYMFTLVPIIQLNIHHTIIKHTKSEVAGLKNWYNNIC